MALKVANRAAVAPFMVMDIMAQASALAVTAAQNNANNGLGRIIHLEIGQPSTPAPRPARQAMMAAMENPASHGYALTQGTPSLRRGIAKHYQRCYGLGVERQAIIATVGSSLGFLLAFLACFEAGDRVAMTNPGYAAYRNLMTAVGLEPMLIDLDGASGWRLTVADLETLETLPDGLIIASPANPTGVVMTHDEIAGVVRWCAKNEVRLISDEIYHGIAFGVDTASVLEFSSTAVVVNSFSKFFSMTGHRVGWMILPDDLVEPIHRLAQNAVISVPTLAQIAATAAITDPDSIAELEAHVKRYHRNRDILLSGLDKRFVGNAATPDGAFYLYIDTSGVHDNSTELAQILLNETHIATTPGADFDPKYGHRALRLSFAGGEADMAEAVRRINHWLAQK